MSERRHTYSKIDDDGPKQLFIFLVVVSGFLISIVLSLLLWAWWPVAACALGYVCWGGYGLLRLVREHLRQIKQRALDRENYQKKGPLPSLEVVIRDWFVQQRGRMW